MEIVLTSAIFVICSKTIPKFDGVPTTGILPKNQISADYRYAIFNREPKKKMWLKEFGSIIKAISQ